VASRSRPEEDAAFGVVSRALGVAVDKYDDGSEPGMVDGVFVLPDGRRGAVEVTTVGHEAAIQSEQLLARHHGWQDAALRWSWRVTIPAGVRVAELRQRLPQALAQCEAIGLDTSRLAETRLPPWSRPEGIAWLIRHGIVALAAGRDHTGHPGAIDVFPAHASGGGAVPDDADLLTDWTETIIARPAVAEHIDKLAAHRADLRHLFIVVHETACPSFAELHALAWSEQVPTVHPRIPDVLDALWLPSRWLRPILWWSRSDGWQRVKPS
jgi:hypothetical protein